MPDSISMSHSPATKFAYTPRVWLFAAPARGDTVTSIVPGPGELPFKLITPSVSMGKISLFELLNAR